MDTGNILPFDSIEIGDNNDGNKLGFFIIKQHLTLNNFNFIS